MKLNLRDGKITGKSIDLRLANVTDAEFILTLRTDPELNKHLSAVTGEIQKQRKWLEQYKIREATGQEYYFVIISKGGEPYGVVRLYDFQGPSFCWGSWIVRREAPVNAAVESALLIYNFAFYTLGFDRSHFDVRKDNMAVNRFHERWGAVVVREDELNYYYEYDEAGFRPINEKMKARYLP